MNAGKKGVNHEENKIHSVRDGDGEGSPELSHTEGTRAMEEPWYSMIDRDKLPPQAMHPED